MKRSKLSRSIRKRIVKFFPHKTAQIDGLNYELDCRELIDRSLYVYGFWEADTRDFIAEHVKPGSMVLEIGANVGAHTLALGKSVGPGGHVYAVEPTEYARNKLLKNIALNPEIADNVTVLNYLITEGDDDNPRRSIKSSWRGIPDGGYEDVASPTITIDRLVGELGVNRLDLLKIDIDGYDYRALLGALNTLEKLRPIAYVELVEWALASCSASVSDIVGYFQNLGYQALNSVGMVPISSDDIERMKAGELMMNGVFVPPKQA
jgi:FkbM family methyltransferase